jgi:hypothetical protein
MRKRNYVVAAVLGVSGALVLSSVAVAAPASPHGFTLTASPAKQQKKVRGAISLNALIDETFVGGVVPTNQQQAIGCTVTGTCRFAPPAVRSQFFLANEFKFTTGKLARNPCSTSRISTASAATARSTCGSTLIGTGLANITTVFGTPVVPGGAQVSAFVSGGNQILIHIDVPQQTNKPVLVGTLLKPATLDVALQPVPGTVIDEISLNVTKKKVSTKKQDKAGKRKFFVSARCGDGTWSSTQLTTFQNGSTSAGTPVNQRCKKIVPKG